MGFEGERRRVGEKEGKGKRHVLAWDNWMDGRLNDKPNNVILVFYHKIEESESVTRTAFFKNLPL